MERGTKVTTSAKHFRAALEPLSGGLGWVVAWLPFDATKAWKKMVRLRVCVEVGGTLFRTSLFSAPARHGQFVLVNKKMQKAAGGGVGTMVDFTISPDLEERTPTMPPELARLLKSERALTKWFAGLSDSTRFEIGKWVEAVKSGEARQRRAEQIAERLMLTMEGEKEPPPVLAIALRDNPVARKGWGAMTIAQRRGHLLGIFYYQKPDARAKRVQKAIEDAIRIAQK